MPQDDSSTDGKPSPPDANDDHTDPFKLIQKGNDQEAANNLWGASQSFLEASIVLRDHSNNILNSSKVSSATTDDCNNGEEVVQESQATAKATAKTRTKTKTKVHMQIHIPRNSEELKQYKIAALYQDQSWEYLHRARETFISAVRSEREQDYKHHGEIPSCLEALQTYGDLQLGRSFEPMMLNLSEQDQEARTRIFRQLFIDITAEEEDRKDLIRHIDGKEDDKSAIRKNNEERGELKQEEQTLTLEERLASLNSSLPSKMKSERERMNDIQAGLDGLGVFMPSSSHNTSNNDNDLLDAMDVSEEEQMQQIMAMAKDEALLDRRRGGNGGNDDSAVSVMELLKKSSIRIDLNDENYDSDEYDAGDDNGDKNNDNTDDDPELNFWKSILPLEEESDPNRNDDPESDVDKMRIFIREAEQMLLQASLCLDEYEEQKLNREQKGMDQASDDESDEIPENRQSDDVDHGQVDLDNDSRGETNAREETACGEHPNNANKVCEIVDAMPPLVNKMTKVESIVTNETELCANDGVNYEHPNNASEETQIAHLGIITAVAMGKGNLEEAQGAIGKILDLWPSS